MKTRTTDLLIAESITNKQPTRILIQLIRILKIQDIIF